MRRNVVDDVEKLVNSNVPVLIYNGQVGILNFNRFDCINSWNSCLDG